MDLGIPIPLALAGPLAPAATLNVDTVHLAQGASLDVTIELHDIDFAFPGSLTLIAQAVSQTNESVQDSAAATVTISETKGMTAHFDPDTKKIQEPGSASFLLYRENKGNSEDAYTATIKSVNGPATANLNGLDDQPTQTISTFRLPGLAKGAIQLTVDLNDFGKGEATVEVTSLSDTSQNDFSTAVLHTESQSPVADAGTDQTVHISTTVTLNGSSSSDPDNSPSPLTFEWHFIDVPQESSLTDLDITDSASAIATFIPDADGDYRVNLTVSDGESSDSDEVIITVSNTAPVSLLKKTLKSLGDFGKTLNLKKN